MRVLWIACGCSLQSEEENPNLTARHENVMIRHGDGRIKLAVAFMADDHHKDFVEKDGISYYPVHADMRIGISEEEWRRLAAELLRVIEDFRPDVIQCFGAEWPYGRIAAETDIPVIIHLMGFLNIYYPSLHMVTGYGGSTAISSRAKQVVKEILGISREDPEKSRMRSESRVMSANRYFLGRTDWDKRIAKYYSPGSRYFHAPEAVKQSIYDAAGSWTYHFDGRLRMFSLSLNDARKGVDIMLSTAKILKDLTDIDFTWKVAGHKEAYRDAEERLGIKGSDVNIELIGMVNDRRLISEMTDADLYIHPSIIDNSPHSICEAQLIGCPVIASNVGGVPQLVEDGKTGLLYPYNEPHTLAFTIADTYRDTDFLTTLSKNAVKAALERNDPKRVADTLIETYERVLREHDDTGDACI